MLNIIQDGQTFRARDTREPGHFWAENEAIPHVSQIGIAAFGVYMVLCSHARNHTGRSWPSIKTLARECDISVNSIKKHLDKLAEEKMILITAHGSIEMKDKTIPRSYTYTILSLKHDEGVSEFDRGVSEFDTPPCQNLIPNNTKDNKTQGSRTKKTNTEIPLSQSAIAPVIVEPEKLTQNAEAVKQLNLLQVESVTHETTVITEPLQSFAKVSPFSLTYTADASALLEPRKMATEPKPKADPIDKLLKDAIAQHIQGIKPDEAVALTGILAQKAAGVWRRRLKVDKLTAEQYGSVARSLPMFVQWYHSSDGCGPDCSLPSGNPNKFEQWYAKFPTDWKPGGMSTTPNGEPMWVQDPEGPGMITPAQRRAKLARMEAERVGSQTS